MALLTERGVMHSTRDCPEIENEELVEVNDGDAARRMTDGVARPCGQCVGRPSLEGPNG